MSPGVSLHLFAAFLLLGIGGLSAQQPAPAGHWEGSFAGPNGDVPVQVDLSINSQGALVGMLATGDVRGVPLSNVTMEGRVVRFEIPSAGARFSGTLAADDTSLAGEFVNAAGAAPSVLERTGDARVAEAIRSAAIDREIEGNWNGTLEVEGRKKRLVLQMTNQPDGTSIGTIVSVDDGSIVLPVTLVQDGSSLTVEVGLTGGVYVATVTGPGELSGTYTERGVRFPLTFRR